MAVNKFVSSGAFNMAAFNGMIDQVNNGLGVYNLITLTAAGWDSSALTQTVTVRGVSADENAQMIVPMPTMANATAYYEAGIYASAQAANSLTFTCTTVPTENLQVYVVGFGVSQYA